MATFWHFITRFGETGVVLPAALLVLAWLWRRAPVAALGWAGALAGAIALVAATKIAFMGFGQGIAALDFTGLSGHSMFAGAAYPLLGWAALAGTAQPWRLAGLAAGSALALLVAISRVPVQAHSVSEVVSGAALGLAVAIAGMQLARRHPPAPALRPAALAGLVVWCTAVLGLQPEPLVPSHEMVTRVALVVSGRERPYTRAEMHRQKKPPLPAQRGLNVSACSGQALLPT